jgi:hypothetical protein
VDRNKILGKGKNVDSDKLVEAALKPMGEMPMPDIPPIEKVNATAKPESCLVLIDDWIAGYCNNKDSSRGINMIAALKEYCHEIAPEHMGGVCDDKVEEIMDPLIEPARCARLQVSSILCTEFRKVLAKAPFVPPIKAPQPVKFVPPIPPIETPVPAPVKPEPLWNNDMPCTEKMIKLLANVSVASSGSSIPEALEAQCNKANMQSPIAYEFRQKDGITRDGCALAKQWAVDKETRGTLIHDGEEMSRFADDFCRFLKHTKN